MRIEGYEFPYPVLTSAGTDYVESCTFELSLKEEDLKVDSGYINIPVSYFLSCEGIQERIDQDEAVVVVRVQSSLASYSRLYEFPKDSTNIILEIAQYDVANKVQLEGMVIAKQTMDEFQCPDEFNETYFASQSFTLRKGDTLACADEIVLYVDDSELGKPLASVVSIIPADSEEEDIVPDFTDEKIKVRLKPEFYDTYQYLRGLNDGPILRYVNCAIVYPVLIEALKIMQQTSDNDPEEYSGKRWYRAIEHRAQKINIEDIKESEESPTTLADKLLGGISFDALKALRDQFEEEDVVTVTDTKLEGED